MSGVAVAVGAAAVIGAVASKSASKSAANSVKKGLDQSADLASISRSSAIDLYNRGRESSQKGLTAAMDFYKKAAPSRYAPVLLGNAAAQTAIGQGAAQANNAILGNPVDMSFAQAQKINPDLSYLNAAQIPEYAAAYADPSVVAEQPAGTSAAGQSSTQKALTAGGLLASPKDMLNPIKAATNPLGLGKKITSKDPGSKLLSKIF